MKYIAVHTLICSVAQAWKPVLAAIISDSALLYPAQHTLSVRSELLGIIAELYSF